MKEKYRAIDFDGYYLGDRLYKWHETNHIETDKPVFDENTQKAKWNGNGWDIEDIEDVENDYIEA